MTVELLEVNPNDPAVQARARDLCVALTEEMGIGSAVAVLIFATARILTAVLHTPSPMWESNVTQMVRLLRSLCANVYEHLACAEEVSRTGSTVKH